MCCCESLRECSNQDVSINVLQRSGRLTLHSLAVSSTRLLLSCESVRASAYSIQWHSTVFGAAPRSESILSQHSACCSAFPKCTKCSTTSAADSTTCSERATKWSAACTFDDQSGPWSCNTADSLSFTKWLAIWRRCHGEHHIRRTTRRGWTR